MDWPAPGVYVVRINEEANTKALSRVSRIADVPNPLTIAQLDQLRGPIGQAFIKMRERGLELLGGISATAFADAILSELYEQPSYTNTGKAS
jgi:hypothetical protein